MIPAALPLLVAATLSALPGRQGSTPLPTFRAAVVGRLVVRQGGRDLPLGEVQRLVGGKRIGLALRSGWQVVTARLDPDGRFSAEVEPGTWRLEAIDVGDGAEVLDEPLEVEARDGKASCAGQIVVTFGDVASELGANAAGKVSVEDSCDALTGAPRSPQAPRTVRALAHPAPDPAEHLQRVGLLSVLYGLRSEALFAGGDDLGFRLSWSVPFRRELAWQGSWLVMGAVQRTWDAARVEHDAVEAGAGFSPYNGVELAGGLQRSGSATLPWAGLRWGSQSFALSARAYVDSGKVSWVFGFDLTPVHVLGSFL